MRDVKEKEIEPKNKGGERGYSVSFRGGGRVIGQLAKPEATVIGREE